MEGYFFSVAVFITSLPDQAFSRGQGKMIVFLGKDKENKADYVQIRT
jgi:hypothetical protein